MTKAIITCFHKYTPFGGIYYEPILDFYLQQMTKYNNEYDRLYIIDSNWNIDLLNYYDKATEGKFPLTTILKVNPHLRYYDAYKEVLPQIKEDLVLFMDNDMVVYKPTIIAGVFSKLNNYDAEGIEVGANDVVSIYDSCGSYKTDKLNGKNKFCPYLFATRKDLLMKYLDIDWGSHLPHSETLGLLTESMLNNGVIPYEMEEDKNSIYFDGTKDGEKGKDLGYYHIKAGSVPAVLLAWKNSPEHNHTYQEYIKHQPKSEYIRQFAWYWYMVTEGIKIGKDYSYIIRPFAGLLDDIGIDPWTILWSHYMQKFIKYHNLQ